MCDVVSSIIATIDRAREAHLRVSVFAHEHRAIKNLRYEINTADDVAENFRIRAMDASTSYEKKVLLVAANIANGANPASYVDLYNYDVLEIRRMARQIKINWTGALEMARALCGPPVTPCQVSECPVCYECDVNGCKFTCGHSFCSTCSSEWTQRAPTCPLCRARVVM